MSISFDTYLVDVEQYTNTKMSAFGPTGTFIIKKYFIRIFFNTIYNTVVGRWSVGMVTPINNQTGRDCELLKPWEIMFTQIGADKNSGLINMFTFQRHPILIYT